MMMNYKFVDTIPNEIKRGSIYISLKYNTAIHKCACGCGEEVVTPLSPTDWKLIYNGKSISLTPSIGNWSFKCQSHYWIKNNQVVWAGKMSKEEIIKGRKNDVKAKKKFHDNKDNESQNKLVQLLKKLFFK
ncbi:hypothetical protein C7954_1154 [Halanaerobium congolense]|uniref:Uncharacterized protein n=1 Tax=Halanaerobium congolense TaxID=54121 RepID=A0A4R8GEM8_9FIRM|nr:DUF6527 family protein [Halanaerobium congolense]TDX43625.1 hypothetical protein C7954_1154 [Halanaerobium congolense]